MVLLSFIINTIAILMIADGVFILIFPQHIEQLVKEIFPKLKIQQVALVELAAGVLILVMRNMSLFILLGAVVFYMCATSYPIAISGQGNTPTISTFNYRSTCTATSKTPGRELYNTHPPSIPVIATLPSA